MFRDGERKLRKELVLDDKLEGIIGLGPDLFYNSSMEACIVILNARKKLKNKVIFINAVDQIEGHENKNRLHQSNIEFILKIYKNFKTILTRSYVATSDEIEKNQFLLNISTYVPEQKTQNDPSIYDVIKNWQISHKRINDSLTQFKLCGGM